MRIIFTISFLVSFHFISLAQDTQVGYIFNKYLDLQDRIEKKKFFVDEFRLNSTKLNWNSKNLHQRTEKYFYDIYKSERAFLNLVSISIDSLGSTYFIEYMFDIEGELLLCTEKQVPKTANYEELRVYFDKGRLILWVEDTNVIKSSTILQSEKVHYLLRSAKFFWDKFQKRMNH